MTDPVAMVSRAPQTTTRVPDECADPVDAILALEREDLLTRWVAVFGRLPPPHTHASFLRLALAWQIQVGRRGGRKTGELEGRKSRSPPDTGLNPGTAATIPRSAKIASPGSSKSATGRELRHGTRIVREWQGKTYHVMVTASGYEYSGTTWRSLSAIAKAITGTAWSGPAFFGIKAGAGK